MKNNFLLFALAFVGFLLLSSCSDDKEYFTFPRYEMGFSSEEIHVGDEVFIGLNLKNNPGQFSESSARVWTFEPDDVERISGGGDNVKIKPIAPGSYTVSVKIYLKNYMDANPSETQKSYDINGTINTITAAGAINSEMVVTKKFRVLP